MKDPSRRHTPSPRTAPYRKRKPSVSPSYLARGRPHERDASHGHPRASGRARDVRPSSPYQTIASSRARDNGQSTPSNHFTADEHRSRSKTGENRPASRSRKHSTTSPGPSQRAQHSSSYSMSTHADAPGPPLRVHLAPNTSAITPTIDTDTPSAQDTSRKTPSPESVDSFLRSIKLPEKPTVTSIPVPNPKPSPAPVFPSPRLPTSHSPRLPTSPTEILKGTGANGSTSNQEHQVNLVYKGFSFTHDLSTLPNDPTGTIALLSITNSDPGAYILVGAHYRRTGRSRAACAIIRSLLARLDSPSDVEQEKGNTQPSSSDTPETTDSPIDVTKPVFKSAAMRPAMLLLAACEMDISREDPTGPESVRHAAKAHDLFRAVYGTVNDAIVGGAARPPPPPQNTLGLEFSRNRECGTSPVSTSAPRPAPASTPGPPPPPPREAESAKCIKSLERELDAARDSQKRLQDKLASTNDRLMRAEDRARTLERRSHEARVQLDASREENLALRQRLVEAERRASESVNGTSASESRVWGKLKDLLFDNLGGARGE